MDDWLRTSLRGLTPTAGNKMIKYDVIKIQYVRPEQKISEQPLSGYKEVRLVTRVKNNGVRVDFFDGDIKWFPLGASVFVLGSQFSGNGGIPG
jgi:hypothetical protein